MGFVLFEKNLNKVKVTPLIGHLLDLEKLFLKTALKMKNCYNNNRKLMFSSNL